MNKNIEISREELKRLLHVQDERTIDSYIKNGAIPKPKKNGDGECYFNKLAIYKLMGLDRDPDEEFITANEVAPVLGIKSKDVVNYAKRKNIPYYRIGNMSGSNTYYLLSEIKKANDYVVKWGCEFPLFVARNHYLKTMFQYVLQDKVIRNLKPDHKKMLIGVVLERKSITEVSNEIGITPQQGSNIFHIACKRAFFGLTAWANKIALFDSVFEENLRLKELNRVLLDKINSNQMVDAKELEQVEVLGIPVDSVNFSVRARNILIALDAKSLGDLTNIQRSYLNKFRNVGKKTIEEIDVVLKEYGLWWKL